MIHVVLISLFFLIFLKYLSWEFKIKVNFKQNLGWYVAIITTTLLASVYAYYDTSWFGNFVLHSVGGGVAVAMGFFYLRKQLKFKFNWRREYMLLLGLISFTGVLNEIFEYFGELVDFMIFTYDLHDTWRDLVANTLGASVCFIIIKTFYKLRQFSDV